VRIQLIQNAGSAVLHSVTKNVATRAGRGGAERSGAGEEREMLYMTLLNIMRAAELRLTTSVVKIVRPAPTAGLLVCHESLAATGKSHARDRLCTWQMDATLASRSLGGFKKGMMYSFGVAIVGSWLRIIYGYFQARLTWKWKNKMTHKVILAPTARYARI
jgi:hypothetical protein